MKDENKTKAELIKELKTLRKERGKSVINDITERKQAEELKNSEERLKILFYYAPDAYYISDLKGNLIDGNKAAERVIGYKREELIGSSFLKLKLLSLADIAKAAKLLVKNLRGQPTGPDEFVLNRKDSSKVTVEISTYPVKIKGKTLVLGIARDITERKQAEEKIKYLNLVLRAIRGVNQLIVKEKNREKLLQGVCNNLIETRGYYNTWIVLLDKKGKLETYAEAGLGKAFLPMIELLERGKLTSCSQKALKQQEVAITKDPASTCPECPLSQEYSGRGAMTIRLEHNGKVYGLMSVSIPAHLATGQEEQSLFKEVADDIAFGLHNIELDEERKQTEEEIKTAAAKWQTTFDAMNDAVSLIDYNGIVLQCNQSYLNLLGKTETEILGKHCWEIVHGTNKPIDGCPIVKMKKSLQRESMLLPVDDKLFNVAVDPIFDANNNLIKAVHIMTDITERKKAESKLQIERDKLTAIFESMADGIYIVNKDYDIQYVNPVLKRTFGPPEGKKCYKYFHDSDEPCTFCKNEEVFAGKTVRWEWTSSKVGRTYDLIDTPLKNADGSISKLEIFRDITERKQSEEALLESEKKYSSVVENSKDGIIVLQKGIIKFLNQAVLDLTGYNSEELIDKEFEPFLLSPEYRQLIMDRYQARFAGKETPSIYEIEVIRKDGISVPIEVSNTTITYGDKKATLSFIRNITERKQAEEKEKEHHKDID